MFKRMIEKDPATVFAAPALIWQIVFLYVPLIVIVCSSFLVLREGGGFSASLHYYLELFKPEYFKVLRNSFLLASATTLVCFLIAYPVSYYLAFAKSRWRNFLLVLLILPSWTNFIVQIYAWFFLLGNNGFVSKLLYYSGVTHQPLHLVNNSFATLIGMTYCYIPFMIFPLYSVLEKLDKRLIEASADLGASRTATLRRVIVPLSVPGIVAGVLLVFVPAFGEFAVPLLLGGSRHVFWGTIIVEKFLISRDWYGGFAFATLGVGMLISVVCTLQFTRFVYKTVRKRALIKHKPQETFLGGEWS